MLAASILGSSMAFVDGSVVNLALPALQATLGATVTDVQWVVEGYSLFLSTLLLIGGALGDRMGRRLVFVLGTALFALASVRVWLAPSVDFLIGARAVQGVGRDAGAGESRAHHVDVPGGAPRAGDRDLVGVVGRGGGDRAGGRWWLIEAASWRWVFWINLPSPRPRSRSRWRGPREQHAGREGVARLAGAALVTAGLGALVYGLIGATHLEPDWTSVRSRSARRCCCSSDSCWREKTAASPMLPLSIFRSRDFTAANVLTLFLYSAIGGAMFFLPFVMIQVHHYSADSDRRGVPAVHRADVRPLALVRRSGEPVRRAADARDRPARGRGRLRADGDTGHERPVLDDVLPAIVVLGIGMGIAVAPLTTTVMGAVSSKHSGLASGINNAVSRTAGLLAVAVFGLVAASRFDRALDARLDAARVPAEVRKVLDTERTKLAGAMIPKDVSEGDRRVLRGAIDEAFVETFRLVTLLTAAMAAISAIAGGMVGKDGKTERRKDGKVPSGYPSYLSIPPSYFAAAPAPGS